MSLVYTVLYTYTRVYLYTIPHAQDEEQERQERESETEIERVRDTVYSPHTTPDPFLSYKSIDT